MQQKDLQSRQHKVFLPFAPSLPASHVVPHPWLLCPVRFGLFAIRLCETTKISISKLKASTHTYDNRFQASFHTLSIAHSCSLCCAYLESTLFMCRAVVQYGCVCVSLQPMLIKLCPQKSICRCISASLIRIYMALDFIFTTYAMLFYRLKNRPHDTLAHMHRIFTNWLGRK